MSRPRSEDQTLDVRESGAPGDVELVRAFVNTLDVEDATDEFESGASAARWLAEHELTADKGKAATAGELARLIEFRESLRAVLESHNGRPLPAGTYTRLNHALAEAPLALRFEEDCSGELVAIGAGVDAALARLAAIVSESMIDGTWDRLKVCPAEDCRWAFYDNSRNRSRTWCEMGYCGNRAKVRAFRERRSGGEPGAP